VRSGLGLNVMMVTRRQLSGTLEKLKLNSPGGNIGILGWYARGDRRKVYTRFRAE
jgi:hypothetical protein